MNYKESKTNKVFVKWIAVIAVFAVALSSVWLGAEFFTNPETYKNTIQSIDEKKATVLGVSAAIAGSATLLAAVPDDSTTPLANELMDLSSYLVLVVCVLVLEKSLLTVFGAISCYFLIPLVCLLSIVFILSKKRDILIWAGKIGVLSIALLIIVPSAIKLSDYIYETNQVVIQEETENVIAIPKEENGDDLPWYTKLWNSVTETVTQSVEEAVDVGKQVLNKFIDAVCLFAIAYCVIPIIVVLAFLWLIKILFGVAVQLPDYSRWLSRKRFSTAERPLATVEK